MITRNQISRMKNEVMDVRTKAEPGSPHTLDSSREWALGPTKQEGSSHSTHLPVGGNQSPYLPAWLTTRTTISGTNFRNK